MKQQHPVVSDSQDDPVKLATGQAAQEWFFLLEVWDGDKTNQAAITRYLLVEHRLPLFWAQSIAIRYLKAV